MALLEEANKINDRDLMVRQEIESHVGTITRTNLRQRIRKPQHVRMVTSPIPLPGPSQRPDSSHRATYSRNYTRPQYQCFLLRRSYSFQMGLPPLYLSNL
jgi:hypothetical protein